MAAFKPELRPTGIGSLPLSDPEEGVDWALGSLPEIPFWPQLVFRSPWEDMSLQFTTGLPCLKPDLENRRLTTDPDKDRAEGLTEFYEADMSDDLSRFALTEEIAPGFFVLLRRIRADKGRIERVKGQVTGPVSLLNLAKDHLTGKAVLHDPELRDAIARGLGLCGAWQVEELKQGFAEPIIFIDEPALSGFGSAFMALEKAEAMALLNATAEPIHQHGGLTGCHCCGNTDWSLILEADIDVVNFDAYGFGTDFILYPKEIAAFLERGGVLAWGIGPTIDYDGSQTAESLVAKLEELIKQLTAKGVNENLIREQSLVTTACGLGPLPKEMAIQLLPLTAAVSDLIRRIG